MTPKASKQLVLKRLSALLLAAVTSVTSLADSEAGAAAGGQEVPTRFAKAVVHDDPHGQHSIDQGAGYLRSLHDYRIPDVALVNPDGVPVNLFSELEFEQPLLLNFIFTSCTAICPVLSATFARVQETLGDGDEPVRMVSISIDPEQDTPERLKLYAQRYHASPGWHFLTGSRADILKVQQAFDAYRGDKMSHVALTFLRTSPDAPWVRIEGFASAADLIAEYRAVVSD